MDYNKELDNINYQLDIIEDSLNLTKRSFKEIEDELRSALKELDKEE